MTGITESSRSCLLILGDQLFPLAEVRKCGDVREVFMAESLDLCTHFNYHKQKILLFLASMRHYRDELLAHDYRVHYHPLDDSDTRSFIAKLQAFLEKNQIQTLHHFAISDRHVEEQIRSLCQQLNIQRHEQETPGFLTSRNDFASYIRRHKQPKMQSFYQEQRMRLGVLVANNQPFGGRWSFDTENRKKLPHALTPPPLLKLTPSPHVATLVPLINRLFSHHPGSLDTFNWPVTRQDALRWLMNFLEQRFALFGPYEDAITTRSDFVFHSALSPILNLGLITPREVLDAALEAAREHDVDIASLEGFVRQLIGWREFIFGIDCHFAQSQHTSNYFNHQRQLTDSWYQGTTGLPPLDACIRKAQRLGYVHHIERLMVLSNLMLLCEIHPQAVYRWFMEMFIDSADWVMGPNVFGMGQFSDGGIFATKPYIAGSNYILKMSDATKGPWCDVMDGLYWRFVAQHRDFFLSQPRMSMMAHMLEKIAPDRRQKIFALADAFIARNTH